VWAETNLTNCTVSIKIAWPKHSGMIASRRQFVITAGAVGLSSAACVRAAAGPITPEMFGAKGDGRTNDTRAFAAMSAHVNRLGGGTIVLRPVTYLVGEQQQGPGGAEFSYTPSDIIRLSKCRLPITIEGNGAILRSVSGLRYGRFDPASGEPLPDPDTHVRGNEAVPYLGMIDIEDCSAPVSISHVELDGNLQGMRIGGKTAKNGWQAGGTGIRLRGNSAAETISRVRSHHHPQDGIILTPSADRSGATTVVGVVCEYNGRQGCSITGGRNFSFRACIFRHTGREVLFGSNPRAGVDIEAERSPVRNVAFSQCEFSDNAGFGLVSGSGDSADIRCDGCKFIGTTNLAAWPDSPRTKFTNCLFVGAINHEFASADPTQATQFFNCTFTDDPTLSPTGEVFLGRGGGKWIAIARPGQNVLFSHCRFNLVGEAILPLSSPDVIYADCQMSQRSPRLSAPLGTYTGTTSFNGNVRLDGAIIRGSVTLNGRALSS
jgi:hypothetical protein